MPLESEEALNQQIRDINEDLQYLLEINQQIHGLVHDQQDGVDRIHQNAQSAADNVQRGTTILSSIRKSPLRYALVGGLSFAAVGTPAIMVAAMSIKAAVVGGVALGVIGGVGGSKYAKKSNEKMDGEAVREKEQRLLREQSGSFEIKSSSKQNKSTKRRWESNAESDGEEDIEIDAWSPRN